MFKIIKPYNVLIMMFMINRSLYSGFFMNSQNINNSMVPIKWENYRPVSRLTAESKIFEEVVEQLLK